MRAWLRQSFGLPLVVSLVLHAAFGAGILVFSSRSAATLPHGTDTRLIVQLMAEDRDTKTNPRVPNAATAIDEDAHLVDFKTPASNGSGLPTPPVVITSPASPVRAATAEKSSGDGGMVRDNGKPGRAGGGAIFAGAPTAKSVVYVVDRSGSMGQHDAYRRACDEVLSHVNQLSPTTRFQVVPYNSRAEPLCVNASLDLLPIDADTLRLVAAQLAALAPTGWTDHLCGLKRALTLSPDVLFLVTDADDLKPNEVLTITKLNKGRTVIHTIELHPRYASAASGELAQLAAKNKGTYRRVLLDD
jgi:von Willebrand factor type A domain